MIRVILSSSAAICAMLILRALFKNRISRSFQYGMTNYVLLLTLACPWCLFARKTKWSLLSAAKPLTRAVQQSLAQPVFASSAEILPDEAAAVSAAPAWTAQTASAAPALTAGNLLLLLWIAGMTGMAVWFLIVNLRFARFLRRNRMPLDAEDRVYICEGLPSPCVFGLFRPSIYVTPEAARDERMLHHVLVHEETHIRQHDPLHALLRAAYLIVYFFNPIVWLAVRCARIDSELACDEAALKNLGEDERLAYGETLLKLVSTKNPDSPLLSTTTMTGRKSSLKARLSRIAFPKKTSVLALLAAILLFASACVATMTGEAGDDTPSEAPGPFAPIFTGSLMLGEADFLKNSGYTESDFTRNDTGRTILYALREPVAIGTQKYTAELHFNHGFEGEPMLQFDYLLDAQTLDDGAIYDALQSAAQKMTDFYGAPDSSALADTHLQDLRSTADFTRDLRVAESWPIPGDWAIPGITGYDVICTAYLRYDPDLLQIRLSYMLEIDRNSVS